MLNASQETQMAIKQFFSLGWIYESYTFMLEFISEQRPGRVDKVF